MNQLEQQLTTDLKTLIRQAYELAVSTAKTGRYHNWHGGMYRLFAAGYYLEYTQLDAGVVLYKIAEDGPKAFRHLIDQVWSANRAGCSGEGHPEIIIGILKEMAAPSGPQPKPPVAAAKPAPTQETLTVVGPPRRSQNPARALSAQTPISAQTPGTDWLREVCDTPEYHVHRETLHVSEGERYPVYGGRHGDTVVDRYSQRDLWLDQVSNEYANQFHNSNTRRRANDTRKVA
jgi:hypothetical protein